MLNIFSEHFILLALLSAMYSASRDLLHTVASESYKSNIMHNLQRVNHDVHSNSTGNLYAPLSSKSIQWF